MAQLPTHLAAKLSGGGCYCGGENPNGALTAALEFLGSAAPPLPPLKHRSLVDLLQRQLLPAVEALAAAGAPLEAYVAAHAAAMGAVSRLLVESRDSKVVAWGYPPPHFGRGLTVETVDRQLLLVHGLGLPPVEAQQLGQDRGEQLKRYLGRLTQQQQEWTAGGAAHRAIAAAAAIVLGNMDRLNEQRQEDGFRAASPSSMLMSRVGSSSTLWGLGGRAGAADGSPLGRGGGGWTNGAANIATAMQQLFTLQLSHLSVSEYVMLPAGADVQGLVMGEGGRGGVVSPGARQASTPNVSAGSVLHANGGLPASLGRGVMEGREQAWQQQQQWQPQEEQLRYGVVSPVSVAGDSTWGMRGQHGEYYVAASSGTAAAAAGARLERGDVQLKDDIAQLASRLRVGLPEYLGRFLQQQ